MKLSKNEKKIFYEQYNKWLNEGLLGNLMGRLFTFAVKKELDKDKNFMQSLRDADKSLEQVDKNLKSLESRGYDIPDYLRRYMK